jgi:glutamine---fructose-6-phosphate transaminase (isomerizing)
MCGIVSGLAQREIAPILFEGLKRLEYRGYDSSGMATISDNQLHIKKETGKVKCLGKHLETKKLPGKIGIAHTRWATHGKATVENAHPHDSDNVVLVHNGIIENYIEIKTLLQNKGYTFKSETDSEVIAHLINDKMSEYGFLEAVKASINLLEGAFGLAVIHKEHPNELIGVRKGSPLVIGVGIGETYLASDQMALSQVTDRFIYLEDDDVVAINSDGFTIWDHNNCVVERAVEKINNNSARVTKGGYKHYMLKEIYEQPDVIQNTIRQYVRNGDINLDLEVFDKEIDCIQIIACGTSYHAGLIAKYWFEEYANIKCNVEVASEYRYRKHVVQDKTLFVTISQSGETADTIAALKQSKQEDFVGSLTICNIEQSTLVRESDSAIFTQAGSEIGVASTKAFTTQLVALLILVAKMAREKQDVDENTIKDIIQQIEMLPALVEETLGLDDKIKILAEKFINKNNTLYLGRGAMYPVALEGALKLKEISYIHAEAYPAGELKHGPLALVDEEMPIIAVAPNDELIEKLKSNLEEVHARGGRLFIFAEKTCNINSDDLTEIINIVETPKIIAPIVYTIPLQLLSYHVAVFKGTDVDQPRNLAKSVTVE